MHIYDTVTFDEYKKKEMNPEGLRLTEQVLVMTEKLTRKGCVCRIDIDKRMGLRHPASVCLTVEKGDKVYVALVHDYHRSFSNLIASVNVLPINLGNRSHIFQTQRSVKLNERVIVVMTSMLEECVNAIDPLIAE